MSNTLVFKNKAEVKKFLLDNDFYEHSGGFSPNDTYYLAYGEYSAPDYKPTKYEDGWGIRIVRHYFPSIFGVIHERRCDKDDFVCD